MIFLAKSIHDRSLIDEIALVISQNNEKLLNVCSKKSTFFKLFANFLCMQSKTSLFFVIFRNQFVIFETTILNVKIKNIELIVNNDSNV